MTKRAKLYKKKKNGSIQKAKKTKKKKDAENMQQKKKSKAQYIKKAMLMKEVI